MTVKKFKCPCCNEKFLAHRHAAGLALHMHKHCVGLIVSMPIWRCFCGEKFSSSMDLREHIIDLVLRDELENHYKLAMLAGMVRA